MKSKPPAQPRGIRNHNPGNIERSGQKWMGLAAQQTDPRFCVFAEPGYGIRAMARLLRNYYTRYGLNTISQILHRWAPLNENDTAAYIRNVATLTGFPRNLPLKLTNPIILTALVKAIIRHENGVQPYSDEEIAWGVQEALKP